MYILDTDHLSILHRGGLAAQSLDRKLRTGEKSARFFTSIISYEEQTRGWLDYIRKAESSKNLEKQVHGYVQLNRILSIYCNTRILSFDRAAALKFGALRGEHRRIGSMDLKIASIALVNKATVLTRNIRDFGRISELSVEDWTVENL